MLLIYCALNFWLSIVALGLSHFHARVALSLPWVHLVPQQDPACEVLGSTDN